ncbi:MAG: 2-amino-4-hydroxy-6-hydroxymethyldihydropteridine diphosphokinase [Steroidobacteraceae bacterium]
MTAVYVAAGSNVEPIVNLRRALGVLAVHYPELRASRAWRNRAVGFEGDDFVNLVVGFDTDEDVRTVLDRLHEAEAACGRARDAPKWAPRSMDLDILLYGERICDEPGLTLPRPDLLRRAYMLGPMAEVAPAVVHPVLGLTMAELWARFDRDAHVLEPVELGWPP